MKLIFTLISIAFLLNTNAQCNSTATKMMVVGDSWAFFSWSGDSYNENLNRFGYSDIDCYSNTNFAVNGAVASNYFDDAARVQALRDYILSNPDLEVVHYSLGGNDAMAEWNNTMTTLEENAVLDVIMIDIKSGIDTILSINPNLKIVYAGYDYPNFSETVGTTPAPFQTSHPYYATWDNMGQPTPIELNELMVNFTSRFIDSANVWSNVHFVNNLGLMQWTYGQITALQVAPYGTYPPESVTLPGGDINYPSPLDALNFGGLDAFHLNDDSYELFIKRHFEEYYWAHFRKFDQSFNADIANCGWTTSTNQSTSELRIGNDASTDEIQTILSFNTTAMDNDKMAESASVFIQRSNLTGDNLMPENLTVSIVTGFFGDDISVDLNDFTSAGDETAVSCTYGTLEDNGFWMRIDLDAALLPFINRYGTTQIKLSYSSVTDTDRFVEFNNETDKITLDLKLVDAPAGIEDDLGSNLQVYPNPANDMINISGIHNIEKLTITDLNGRVVLEEVGGNPILYISELSSGIYILKVVSNGEIFKQKIVKQ